jgi:hypothetical protein
VEALLHRRLRQRSRDFLGKTSNAVKQRWKKSKYTQVNVALPQETVRLFKARCKDEGVSMASELYSFMSGAVGDRTTKTKTGFKVTTRPQRRKTLALLILHIEAVMEAETDYMEAIPDNLRSSVRYDAAEQAVSALEEALGNLMDVYD